MANRPEEKVKLRVPDACRGIAVDGEALPIAADGALETDRETAAALAAHGAVPWRDEVQPAEIATLAREDLIALFMARTMAALKEQGTETIRASLTDDDEDEPSPDVTRDEIAHMNRAAVLAYLAARDVTAPSGASLAELRVLALETLED